MIFSLKSFAGMVPRANPRLIPDNVAQVATNCKTDKGTLRPFMASTIVNTPTKAGTKRTIYKYGAFWLHWLEDVDVARNPVANDTQSRIYWTGEGVPKKSDATIISSGGTNYPTNSFTLGIPAVLTAPTVTLVGASTDPDTAESRSYVVTYVSADGEEGPPSPTSAILVVEPTQSVNLTGIPTVPSGAYNITRKNIYRTSTGTDGTTFKFVAWIAIGEDHYSDTIASASLGEDIPSTHWSMPPAGLHSLKLHPSGFMVGLSGKDVCFSVQYMPHAWPETYRIAVGDTPIGLGIFGNTVLVLTDSYPYVITGTDPEYMVKERIEVSQSCVSKRGIVDMGVAVAYPSPDGLMVIGSGVSKNATENIYTRDQWQELNPSTLISAFHDGKYYGMFGTTGIVLDFTGEDVKSLTFGTAVTAAYSDPLTDTLYFQSGTTIISWDSHATSYHSATSWKSKVFVMPYPVPPPTVGQVRAAAYPVTLKLYANGTLKHTQTVSSAAMFRMAGGYRADEYEIELSASTEIYSATLTTTMDEMKKAVHP